MRHIPPDLFTDAANQLLPNKTTTASRFILNSSVITYYRTDAN
nr:MAG TPA_asm: hypothetical protein [Caudoviricetes sp.]DAL23589.1 MAG TPA_asm: hypothetical protein [Caudoviricetes sp.]DAP99945.1 MAG TPA: hypothetical protein [Caudoviricetes sp.]DAY60212.1 MAG TPA: hypothetical protein [Caudoviricetes sp.]